LAAKRFDLGKKIDTLLVSSFLVAYRHETEQGYKMKVELSVAKNAFWNSAKLSKVKALKKSLQLQK